MKYKISYYDQSLSKLYLRSLEKGKDGYFSCLVFWGTKSLSMPCAIEIDDKIYIDQSYEDCKKEKETQRFYFSRERSNYVEATSVQGGKAKDFPEVEKIEITELSKFEVKYL